MGDAALVLHARERVGSDTTRSIAHMHGAMNAGLKAPSRRGRHEWHPANGTSSWSDAVKASCVLATVSFSGHFRVLVQFYLSYAANVLDPHACDLMVLVSTDSEATSLSALLHSPEYATQLSKAVLPRLTIVALPAVVTRLSPGTSNLMPSAKNRGQWGRLYVCAKKAYAARYAHEVLGAEHAIVTDSEAYIWKPLSIASLFASALAEPTVWFADAPSHKSAAAPSNQALPARVDANWCSLHVFSDARGLTRQGLQQRVPSSSATLFENMLFSYPRTAFRAYWSAVEQAWQRPWFDALVRAHEVEPRCVAVGFWLEVSWHLFLYGRHRPPYSFVNATARIEDAFGHSFARHNLYVNARLELLWRAVSNATFAGFRTFYARQPLPFFRYEHRQRGNCLPLRLVAEVPPPAASFQANSAVPNWVFERCAAELQLLQAWRHEAAVANASARLPWVRHSTTT